MQQDTFATWSTYAYDLYFTGGYTSYLTDTAAFRFLIHSEIVFLVSLIALVFALTLAHIKMDKGSDTLKRLSILSPRVKIMQWLSDYVYTLLIWLSHLVVIFLFYVIYISLTTAELVHPHYFYQLFARERYLYMLFPILNPLSLIRMLSLVLAISFLPSLISDIIENISGKEFSIGDLFMPILLIGLIGWGYFEPTHEWSLIVCVIAMIVGAFCYRAYLLKWEVINAESI